jgi:hypothetical protein
MGGRQWAEYAYVGPWGTCVGGSPAGGVNCMANGPASMTGRRAAVETTSFAGNGPYFVVVAGARGVDHVIVRPAKGRAFRVGMVTLAGGTVCAFAVAHGDISARWTAYSAAGAPLASGRIP